MNNSNWTNYKSNFVYNLLDSSDIIKIGIDLSFDNEKPEIKISFSKAIGQDDINVITNAVQKSILYKMHFDILVSANIVLMVD